VEYQQEIKIK